MGLLTSVRNDQTSYRMYDDEAVRRIEQILILRKLNISIKDIKLIFNSSDSRIVLDVLGKKIDNIDEEVSLLHELKEIVLAFIQEIESINFSNQSDVKQLYERAKEIENQIVGVDYVSKPANAQRLIEITSQLDKKVPDVMVVRIPPFRVLTTGVHPWMEIFKEGGKMFQLWQHYSLFQTIIFDCLDFTVVHSENEGEMICSIKDTIRAEDVAPLELIDFPGGLYAMAVSIDDDDESIQKVQDKISQWIVKTKFAIDDSRHFMFNMPYLDEENQFQKDIEKGLGYRQQQRYVPIKLKETI